MNTADHVGQFQICRTTKQAVRSPVPFVLAHSEAPIKMHRAPQNPQESGRSKPAIRRTQFRRRRKWTADIYVHGVFWGHPSVPLDPQYQGFFRRPGTQTILKSAATSRQMSWRTGSRQACESLSWTRCRGHWLVFCNCQLEIKVHRLSSQGLA